MLSGRRARIRSLWSGVFRRREAEAELREEFDLHMELRAADLVKSGMAPDEAARVARAEFGGAFDQTMGVREARGLGWLDSLRFSALDFKLGARMLARYPGLTVIASLSMGVAIAIGATVFSVLTVLRDPSLPLPEGDRIVSLRIWNTRSWAPEYRIVHEFSQWRTELRTVRDVSAYRGAMRNIVTPDGPSEPTRAAAMTASGFRVAGVAPALGRYLLEDDEKPGAKLVAVLGYDVWQSRFAGDSSVIGREVMLGSAMHTIVGVMPDGFHFPSNHSLWVPFSIDATRHRLHEGPVIFAFGRLAPEATMEEARAELTAIADRNRMGAAESENLTASVVAYAQSWVDLDTPDGQLGMQTARLAVLLLLTIISVNVAILVYARTATRQREIAVRTALGASRTRIVTQLFGEALLLAGAGAAIGLVVVGVIAANVEAMLPRMGVGGLPYWIRFDVTVATIRHIVLLAVGAAAMIGILPALQVTGRRVQRNLQHFAGQASVRMGRTWTALIVIEVAITVAVLPTTLFIAQAATRASLSEPGFAAGEVLSAQLLLEREFLDDRPSPAENHAFYARYFAARDELLRRVRADKGIRSATFAADPVGSEAYRRWELDTAGGMPGPARAPGITSGDPFAAELAVRARLARVEVDYLRAFDIPLLAGREFGPADADTGARTVLVNRSFVNAMLQGRNAIGRRLRTIEYDDGELKHGPWLEIVGVVGDFPNIVDIDRPNAAVYQSAGSRELFPSTLQIHVAGTDAAVYSERLRETAAAVMPALQMREVLPMDDVIRNQALPLQLGALGLLVVTLSVVVLSAAGIYSLMSVVVSQRRREIGIRMALGAGRREVLTGIFKRATAQLCLGVAAGLAVAGPVRAYGGGALNVLSTVALLAMAIGVFAALGPARRALAIQPTEVLRED